MLRDGLEHRVLRVSTRRADARGCPIAVGAKALPATLSMSVPFANLLVASVLLPPRRGRSIAAWSGHGAALGALRHCHARVDALRLVLHGSARTSRDALPNDEGSR